MNCQAASCDNPAIRGARYCSEEHFDLLQADRKAAAGYRDGALAPMAPVPVIREHPLRPAAPLPARTVGRKPGRRAGIPAVSTAEVSRLLAKGKKPLEIAEMFGVRRTTIEYHQTKARQNGTLREAIKRNGVNSLAVVNTEDVKRLTEEGMTPAQIATKFGVGQPTIHYHLNKFRPRTEKPAKPFVKLRVCYLNHPYFPKGQIYAYEGGSHLVMHLKGVAHVAIGRQR